ncbi:hypothetical protein [Agarilytica rhodophyticola]
MIEARFEINTPVKVRIRDKFLVVIHDT